MTAETPPLDTRVLKGTVADLSRVYEGIFSPETVERYVFDVLHDVVANSEDPHLSRDPR